MVEPPYYPARRGATRRARLRRRRLAAAATLMLVLALIGVVVVSIANGGGSSRHARGTVANVGRRVGVRSGGSRSPRPLAIEARGDAVIRRLARLGLPVYCAGHHGNEVAFTFDDGPGPYTHYALKKLSEAHERATFFVVGRSMNFFPGWLPRELKVAALGDHTYTHPLLTRLSAAEISSEIERTKQKIDADSGQPVYLFRPPYGGRDATVDRVAAGLGLLEIIWSVDSADSLGANYAGIIRNVEAGLRPGAIILMHENRGQTIRALTTLLPELKRRHLRSVSLPELFAADPPSEAQVRLGPHGCAGAAVARPGSGG